MKKQIYLVGLAVFMAFSFVSCKKSSPPILTTKAVSSITETTAASGGDITDEGSSAVTARGVCWATTENPTADGNKTTDGSGSGSFESLITGLTPGAIYHVRAYATNTEETGYGEDVTFTTASLIKSIGVVYSDGVERYDITYDATKKRIVKIEDFWNDELDKTITYDYSVAGKLTITKGSSATVYDINDKGMVTKEDWGGGEYAAYQYDNDGYLVKIIEHWGGADHLKMQATITNGSIMKHTTYDDDGVTVKRYKEFFYTVGENTNNIFQTSMVDNNTLPLGNLFGKPSKKLVDYLEYWDPRTSDPKRRTTITYEFDSKNRPSKITRTGDWGQEVYTYAYYD